MCIVGQLEAIQISLFPVSKLPEKERSHGVIANHICHLIFDGNGQNLPGFMVGRQLTVVICFFLVGSITGMNVTEETGNIFGVSDSAQEFLNFGFQGAIMTTVLASISWRYAAAAYPNHFINNPIGAFFVYFSIGLDKTGITGAAWVIACIVKKAQGLQYNEMYVGTAEEQKANYHPDNEVDVPGGGFIRHQCGSHDVLDGPIRLRDAIDVAV
jgi:hypothetical protein